MIYLFKNMNSLFDTGPTIRLLKIDFGFVSRVSIEVWKSKN